MSPFEILNIREIKVWDILDIAIIWFIIYNLLKLLRGSRSTQILAGLLALFLIQLIAEFFNLMVLARTIGSMFNIIPIAILVLFQDEIRKVLASIGTNPFSSYSPRTRSSVLDNIFQAVLKFSERDIGALILFTREHGLGDYIESGTRLDAIPSTELLQDIFQPKSSLHDGAVIVSKDRIASAACLLPLSSNPDLPRRFGTRHRAAVGITEESDCIALVVSEETGNISFFSEGNYYEVREKTISQLYETYNSLTMPVNKEKLEAIKSFSKRTFFWKPKPPEPGNAEPKEEELVEEDQRVT